MGDHQNSAGARHSNGDKTLFRYGRSGSGYVTAKGSPKTLAASWNETRCFRRFCLALPGSHSKFTISSYRAAARGSNQAATTCDFPAGGPDISGEEDFGVAPRVEVTRGSSAWAGAGFDFRLSPGACEDPALCSISKY